MVATPHPPLTDVMTEYMGREALFLLYLLTIHNTADLTVMAPARVGGSLMVFPSTLFVSKYNTIIT
jgi:hypothetical protein